jgi:hypothetical protein
MRVMGDWLLALPLPWMTLVIFAAAYLVAAGVYLVVVGLAVNGLARVFKAFSPQMLTPLGVIFGLIVGFVALQTWNDFDKAKVAVVTEAWLYLMTAFPKSRGCIFALSSIAT